MLELRQQSAFANVGPVFAANGIEAAEVVGRTIAMVLVRNGREAELTDTIKARFAIDLPTGPNRAEAGGLTFLGIGPGRWLAIIDATSEWSVSPLVDALQGLASVVDQSGGLGILRLTGDALLELLSKGVQVDLAPEAFPAGSVIVTTIAHVSVTLWKIDNVPTIEIAVARSFAGSFHHWLRTSANSLGR